VFVDLDVHSDVLSPGQSLGDERRHPQGVIAIDAPGKGDDGPSVTGSFGGADVDVMEHGGGLWYQG
jgi:hypothetical protein